jgi:MFS family permease
MGTPIVSPDTQRRALTGIAISQLFVLTVWFSATATAPQLAEIWSLTTGQTSLLTLAVQLGFVVGALTSALFSLPDLISARKIFLVSSLIAALTNGGLILLETDPIFAATSLRFATGVALAGVYPAGLKVVTGWFTVRRGTAMGVLLGALTVGSAFPHLIRGWGVPWQAVIGTSSVLAAIGGLIMWWFVSDGPHEVPTATFSLKLIGQVVRNRGVRLSTYGYLGHMWELYAMWTWTAAFLSASALTGGFSDGWASTATFFIVGVGALGSWLAGRIADKHGREKVAAVSMGISGTCALLTPLVFGANPVIVVTLFVVWGFTVIADSAQFSAMVAEHADERFRGTALTLQTAVGFTLTLVTIRGVPVIVDAIGWKWAFPWLALGPALGIVAMIRLYRSQTRPI